MDILALDYTFNDSLLIRKRDETTLAYNPDNSDMYEMNDVAGEIIFLLKEEKSIREIVAFLAEEYGEEEAVILADITDLILRFIDLGIIRVKN